MQAEPTPSEAPAPADLARRVGTILGEVEAEAARIRFETRAEADRLLAEARREADALVAERRRRIAELSDEIVARSEAVAARLEDAAPIRRSFDNLVGALGDAAERLAGEIESEAGAARRPESAPAPFAGAMPGA